MPIDENKIEQINVRSEFFQDILDKIPSRILRMGNAIILLIFILIAIGLRVIKYPDVINTEVLVTTDTPPVEVHCQTSGRISKILKKDQDSVKIGDWIIVLNNSANYKDVRDVKAQFNSVNTSNFWNAIDTLQINTTANLGDLQSGYNQFSKSVEELHLFVNLKSHYQQLGINSDRKKTLELLKQQLDRQLSILEREVAISKFDYERNLKLDSEKVIAKTDLEKKELVYLNSKNSVEQSTGSLIDAQQQAELLKKENITLKTDETNTYFTLRKNVLQNYYAFLIEVSEWQNKFILIAPFNGIINFYETRSEDQFLTNEQKIFTVTPTTTQNYFAIIKLPITNSGKVRIGLNCNIMLANYSYAEFGILKGIIESISLAAKEGFYNVKVKLPNQLKTNTHKQLVSKSELLGSADIVLEDQTLFDRIFNSLISKKY